VKSTVERLSPTRVRINVEVPFDELKPDFDRAYKKIAQQVNVPGFRKGKVPARIIEARLGRGVVLEQVVNDAIPTKYSEAVTSAEDVTPLGQPEIEVTEIADNERIAFTAEVDVRPEITLPELSSLAVQVDDVAVTDADVDEALDNLRARFATLTGVERPAAKDDFVQIDLAATVDGAAVEEAQTSGLSYQVGQGGLIDGIDDAITGLSAGESATFPTTLVAGEYKDREAEVTVTVTAVKERQLPDSDDDFAQLASEFDTLDELTADLRTRLGRVREMEQLTAARDKVLDALVDATEVPLPEGIVKSEVDARVHDAIHPFDHDEEKFAEFLEENGKTREEFDTEAREDAEKSVRVRLVLDALADDQEVTVSQEELTERIVFQAQQYQMPPEQFIQRIQEAGQLGAIYSDVRRSKALIAAVREATVTDSAGTALDMGELLGDGKDGGDEQEPENEKSDETTVDA
jgi:trigger factor